MDICNLIISSSKLDRQQIYFNRLKGVLEVDKKTFHQQQDFYQSVLLKLLHVNRFFLVKTVNLKNKNKQSSTPAAFYLPKKQSREKLQTSANSEQCINLLLHSKTWFPQNLLIDARTSLQCFIQQFKSLIIL